VREHAAVVGRLGAEVVEIRSRVSFSDVDALILPGGESTTMGLLLDTSGLRPAVEEWTRRANDRHSGRAQDSCCWRTKSKTGEQISIPSAVLTSLCGAMAMVDSATPSKQQWPATSLGRPLMPSSFEPLGSCQWVAMLTSSGGSRVKTSSL